MCEREGRRVGERETDRAPGLWPSPLLLIDPLNATDLSSFPPVCSSTEGRPQTQVYLSSAPSRLPDSPLKQHNTPLNGYHSGYFPQQVAISEKFFSLLSPAIWDHGVADSQRQRREYLTRIERVRSRGAGVGWGHCLPWRPGRVCWRFSSWRSCLSYPHYGYLATP